MTNDRLKAIAIEQGAEYHHQEDNISPILFDDLDQLRAFINAVNAEENTPTLPADMVAYIKQLEEALYKISNANNEGLVKNKIDFFTTRLVAKEALANRPAILDKASTDGIIKTAIEKQKQKEYQDMMVCKKCNVNRGKEADCFYPHACAFTGVAHNE